MLSTLVVQGLSLKPLIRLLRLDRLDDADQQMADARMAMAKTGLAVVCDDGGADADNFRYRYAMELRAGGRTDEDDAWARYCAMGRAAIAAERDALDDLRERGGLGSEAFYELQEGLDWRELSLMPEEDRRIEES